jgi:pimeloyl-ACP methyl ester carboxylesterase
MVRSRRRRLGRIVLGVGAALALAVIALNWTWGRLPAEPKPTGRFVRIGDVRVRVLERPGSGPAVVLIHGLPGTADDFDRVTPLLTGERTIAYDRPGFGFSSGGYHPLDAQLAALGELIDRLGGGPVVLVGHSYGGTLALAFAERRPAAVRGLVLVDAAAAGERASGFARAQAHLIGVLSWPLVEPLADATFSQAMRTAAAKQGDAQAFAPGPVDPGHEHRLLAINMRHDDLDALAGEQLAFSGVVGRIDERLASIAVPVVVIQGASDRLVAARYGRRLAASLPHARLAIVRGGHMQPYVHPGVVAAAVRSVLAAGGAGSARHRARRAGAR